MVCLLMATGCLFQSTTVTAQERLPNRESIKKVILDTDPSSDPDDVGCIAMLHALANRGECEILAVINSIHHREASLSISAINQFFHRPEIPVGDYKGYAEHVAAPENLYTSMLADQFPRTLKSHTDALDSVSLYREILASAEPKSITIVVIGTMHNLSALLKSGGCSFSPLSGIELVKQKVKLVCTMGGNFIEGQGHDRTNWGGSDALCGYTEWSCLNKERNEMCRFVIENCSSPFVASGWEVGCGDYHNAKRGNVMTGQALKQLDDNHIVRRSYEFHFAARGGDANIDRHSNDQCALLYAIRGEGKNFEAHLNGKISLSKKGDCQWVPTPDGRQGYIQKKRSKEKIAAEIESLMMAQRTPADASPPPRPTNVMAKVFNNDHWITWSASNDSNRGSWVTKYHVYQNGTLIGTAFGTRFRVEPNRLGKPLEVRAVNASGAESRGALVR